MSQANSATNDAVRRTVPSAEINTVKKCMCCGTQLQVPDGLAYFKCSICDTFHDLKDISNQEPEKLDLAMLQELIIGKDGENITENVTENEDEEPVNKETTALDNSKWKAISELLAKTCSDISNLKLSFAAVDSPKKLSYSKPNIDFDKLASFYALVVDLPLEHCMQVVMNSYLSLLKRTKKPLEATDLPFLLIIIENPVLINSSLFSQPASDAFSSLQNVSIEILERCIGHMAHCSKPMKAYLLNWFSRYPVERLEPKVNLLNAYVAHKLTNLYKARRRSVVTRIGNVHVNGGYHRSSSSVNDNNSPHSYQQHRHRSSDSALISSVPQFPSITYHSIRSIKRRSAISGAIRPDLYANDWHISAFVRVLAILFNANMITEKIPISCFYNTMVDYTDITSDFDHWQRLGGMSTPTTAALPVTLPTDRTAPPPAFTFCQYPFLLSMGSKTEILEYDARRQMELKAQEAFFGSIANKGHENPFLYIKIHRDKLLEESLAALEKNEDNLKKSLKVEFIGEPGVDAGGLRKEWFLLLLRDLFNPASGLFTELEESRYCWFDRHSKAPLKLFKLTGVAIGLALYNSTILDINFPLVFYKKLLGVMYTLEDFCTVNPSYGKSLMSLLAYEEDEDFEQTFCLTFSVSIRDPKTGKVEEVPIVPHGETKVVTRENRNDFVRRILEFYFDKSVHRQFEALKQGFYCVVGGNALSLFRPEELELLVRGSADAIDVDALRSVTKYQHWVPKGSDPEEHMVIKWFWKFFKNLDPQHQRKLLHFVTGSDRIPATGIANVPFRISKIGEDSDRFPTAHTCFNQLCLYAYSTRQKMEDKLLTAITESQGFGIK